MADDLLAWCWPVQNHWMSWMLYIHMLYTHNRCIWPTKIWIPTDLGCWKAGRCSLTIYNAGVLMFPSGNSGCWCSGLVRSLEGLGWFPSLLHCLDPRGEDGFKGHHLSDAHARMAWFAFCLLKCMLSICSLSVLGAIGLLIKWSCPAGQNSSNCTSVPDLLFV